ncbi:MAG: Ig-like domain-containing protein, partial [Bellilinea sp.]
LLDVSNTTLFNPVLVPGSGGGGTNTPPTVSISSPADGASFANGAVISFAGSAQDAEDGDLTSSLVWTSSLDGQIGTGGAFTAVLSAGTHTITASVSDSGGLAGDASITVTVEPPAGGEILLSVRAYMVKTNKYAELTWSGATFDSVDVYRNGVKTVTTANDGLYVDKPLKSLTSATYKVCEAGTTLCSNEVTVTW